MLNFGGVYCKQHVACPKNPESENPVKGLAIASFWGPRNTPPFQGTMILRVHRFWGVLKGIMANVFAPNPWNGGKRVLLKWPGVQMEEFYAWLWVLDKLRMYSAEKGHQKHHQYLGLSPFPVIVTTRIITFSVGNPYKPAFRLLLGRGTTQPISVHPVFLFLM